MQIRRLFSRFTVPVLIALWMAFMSIGGSSCKKEQQLQSGGEIRFSTDTLTFDTVFTSLGSATVGLRIYNPQDQEVIVSSIRLAGGASSYFHLNVDGKAGPGENIVIAARDSIYVFATVKIDPTDENTPFLIEDRLVATLNGRDFSIPVLAYGQNAYYIRGPVRLLTQTLKTDKPYVVMDYVEVGAAQTLTIPAGCRLYMHANARIFVDGTLNARGTKKDSIIFQGDRLDRSYFGYEGYPGEWGGIYFTSRSTNNVLEHVILRNCGNGAQGAPPAAIQVAPDSVADTAPQLSLDRVTIENSIGYGLLSFNGTIKAENTLIHSCGASALALVQGGNYELNNCTFAIYGNNKINHNENPAAIILNYYEISQSLPPLEAPLNAVLRNCVIAGSLENEFVADSISTSPASLSLRNCVIKADEAKIRPWVDRDASVRFTRPDGTLDPLFLDVAKMNYRLKAASPLVDAGMRYPAMPAVDRDDRPRIFGAQPDIGCYEFMQ